jgi:hypothetical protein
MIDGEASGSSVVCVGSYNAAFAAVGAICS